MNIPLAILRRYILLLFDKGENQIVLDTVILDESKSTDDDAIVKYTWTLVELANPNNDNFFEGDNITVTDHHNGTNRATLIVLDEARQKSSDEILISAYGPGLTISEGEQLIADAVKEATIKNGKDHHHPSDHK